MKTAKRFISILLAIVIAAGLLLPAFAVEKKNTGIPVINVDGIATRTLYLNPNTPEEQQVFYPTSDTLTNAIKSLALPAAKLAVDKNWNAFGDKLIPLAKTILDPISCNPDGTVKYNVAIKDEWSIPAGYNFDTTLSFSYDWRLDPMDNSKRLNDYIKFVKQETGCEKVDLIPNSMGGTIVMAYLEQFGTDDVNAIVMRSSAFQGVSLVGELFNKQLQINKRSVLGYVKGFLKADKQSEEMNLLISALDTFGVVDMILPVADNLIYNLKDRIYNEVLIETFGYLPGIWSLVPDKYYESAKAIMLDPVKNAELIRKIDIYHYDVQNKVKDLLQDAINKGVKVAVISNYNLYGCPITENPDAQTDFLIDTVYSSGGATCSPLGSTLGSGYIQAVNCGHNHISPDNIIDASTCMFPEYTWFVKGMRHTNFNDDYNALVNWILNYNGQPTVFDNASYPQFLQLNKADNTLSPVVTPMASILSNLQIIFKILQNIKLLQALPAK